MSAKFFIDRPVLATCISFLMVLLGFVSITVLPIEQYPDIAPPTVSVTANYTGANADTVQKTVIIPLEEAINGVEDMLYMTSTATNSGSATIQVYFKQGVDADMAAVNVQNRVAKAQSSLPADVISNGVTTEKQQAGQLKIICIYSTDKAYDETFLSNYLNINVVPEIKRISGVGGVTVLGNNYAMRIWLDSQKMVEYKVVPSDISKVLSEQNIEAATGTLGSDSDNTFLYALKYRGRYETPEQFGNLVIKSLPNGNVLRLKDVASIELGAESYSYSNKVKGFAGSTFMVMQAAGSNANDIILKLNELEDKIRKDLPRGVYLVDLFSAKDFLDASIDEVIETLVEAIFLVIIVVYIFLQSIRSTVIPLISIIVSLIATFAFIYVAGFSINLLTLFALILVIGTVVDDAIVVVEAVQAKFEGGCSDPYDATVDAMKGISSAIVTTSLVFMSVFVPVCFMGGTSGTFYTQFGVTMAVAVGISAVNALTLSPALCALFMKATDYDNPENQKGFSYRFHVAFDTAFEKLTEKYLVLLKVIIGKKIIAGIILVVSLGMMTLLMFNTKTGLIPDEDTGTVFVAVVTSPGYTLNQTKKSMDEVQQRIQELPQIDLLTNISGYNLIGGAQSSSGGTFIIKLKNWEERPGIENSKDAVIYEIMKRTSDITSAMVFAFSPPMIPGYGTSNGLTLSIQDRTGGNIANLSKVTSQFNAAMEKEPSVMSAITTFDPRFPQFKLEVDAPKCIRMGVSPSDVLNTIALYIGGGYSSDVNLYSKKYKVMIQARTDNRLDEGAFSSIFVRNNKGEMLPIVQFMSLERVYGPELLNRFNLFSSISVNVSLNEGYSTGEGIKAVEKVAKEVLPQGYSFEYSGMTRDEASSGSTTIIIYSMCLIFIFLILSSLYESLLIPFAVMLSIPSALLGSFIFAQIMGVENNIYMQTGLIMLIGLIAKTAILLTEFASEEHKKGKSIVESAIHAAKVRLRPILMTSICMVVGLLPLVVAHGVGANGNRSLGVTVVGGMLVGILALVLITPVFFIIVQTIQEKFSKKKSA
ncbi:efflux RND transporter permease subunit [Succinivibrio dextrinosolvens]|uniref:Efflux pump membrane transporter n=1 Tax=Succinivibrio dextrinosolvens TaxID=83771 RepID=A0A662ZAG0_9GAMM|nr:efflux RND transporter permease subunit [Succinivibrio dextrinosolvens]SFK08998.1 hydrophobe/amphiphile efflux-1 (HAE1) family protein [Succinivibrio dextrinosolvens]